MNRDKPEPHSLQAKIGSQLRELYAAVLAEPNPFDDLLPPDRPPPGAPGQRRAPECAADDDLVRIQRRRA